MSSSGAQHLHALLQAILQLSSAVRPLPGAWSLFHHLVLSMPSPRTATLRRWSHTQLHAATYSSMSLAHATRQAPALVDHPRLVKDAPIDAAQLTSLLALLRTGQHSTILAEGCASPHAARTPTTTPLATTTTSRTCRQQADADRATHAGTISLMMRHYVPYVLYYVSFPCTGDHAALLGCPSTVVDMTDPNINHLYTHHYLPMAREAAASAGLRIHAIDTVTQAVFTMLQYTAPSPSACAAAVAMLADVLVNEHGFIDATVVGEADHPAWHTIAECITRIASANTLGTLRCAEDVTLLFEAAGRMLGEPPGSASTLRGCCTHCCTYCAWLSAFV